MHFYKIQSEASRKNYAFNKTLHVTLVDELQHHDSQRNKTLLAHICRTRIAAPHGVLTAYLHQSLSRKVQHLGKPKYLISVVGWPSLYHCLGLLLC
jgi:hypothetical protein